MKKELSIKNETYALDKPAQMAAMSNVLKKHIVDHKLYAPISGKNYAMVEGWQFAGGLMGLFPRIVSVTNLSSGAKNYKWQAHVEIIDRKTDKVVSTGFAVCSNEENRKKSFDEYAVLSMAQTRAIGKAYRNLLGWVMKLAGYEGTPSEEMVKMGEKAPEPATQSKTAADVPVIEAECGSCGNPITKQEVEFSKKMFKKQLCRDCQAQARKNK